MISDMQSIKRGNSFGPVVESTMLNVRVVVIAGTKVETPGLGRNDRNPTQSRRTILGTMLTGTYAHLANSVAFREEACSRFVNDPATKRDFK